MKNRTLIFVIITIALFMSVSISGVFAETTVNIDTSDTTVTYYRANPVVIDSNITVSGDSITNAKVSINNIQSGDVLSYPGTAVTKSWDGTKGILTLSGTKTGAEWQEILRTVTFNTTSSNGTDREITFSLGNAIPFMIGQTQHFYEFINGSYSWPGAETAAEGRSLFGLQGYLATITSLEENTLIKDKLGADAWIGATDTAVEGTWKWVTGPEAGTVFSIGNLYPVAQNGNFMYWNSQEPNDSGGAEDYCEIYSSGSFPGKWNDLGSGARLGYVVEYGGTTGDPEISLQSTRTLELGNNVSLDKQGGSGGTDSIDVISGEQMPTVTPPTRTGYSFGGYYTGTNGSGTKYYNSDGSSANNWVYSSSAATLYAKWTANTYTVNYNANGGSGSTASSTHTYDSAKALTSNGFTKTGYTFAGWATSSTGSVVYSNAQSVSNLTATNGATVNLYAKWTPNTYTITFDINGGGSVTPTTQDKLFDSTYGKASNGTTNEILPTPTRTYYAFDGWFLNSNCTGTSIIDSSTVSTASNHTLYAKWIWTTADSNSSTISINDDDSYTNSTTVSLTLSAPGASQMLISENSDFSGAAYETYLTNKSFTLSSSNGSKTIYVKYKDSSGNETSPTSDTIILDTVSPTVEVISDGSTSYNRSTILISIAFSESVTGFTLDDIAVGNGTAANLEGSGATYTAAITPSADGIVTVDIASDKAMDLAGNGSTASTQIEILSKTFIIRPKNEIQISDCEIDDTTIRFSFTDSKDTLPDYTMKSLIKIGKSRTIIVGGNGVRITIPAGTLNDGDDINDMIPVVSGLTSGPNMVISYTDGEGTSHIVPWSSTDNGQVDFIAGGNGIYNVVDNRKTFKDIEDHWAKYAIEFVSARELFNGVGEDKFSPEPPMTRGMMVTALYRLNGLKEGNKNSFTDVPDGHWYSKAVDWGETNNIAKGYGNGNFGPEDNITREQLVAMLYRYAEFLGEKRLDEGSLQEFSDRDEISEYALKAMRWATQSGIILGRTNGEIDPETFATRAEVAAIMTRFIKWTLAD